MAELYLPEALFSDAYESISIIALSDTPAVDGAAVKKLFRGHDAVLFEDHSVFHHERDLAKRVQIFQRIARNRDHIGGHTLFDRTAFLLDTADFVSVARHDFEDFFCRDSRGLPTQQKIDRDLATS